MKTHEVKEAALRELSYSNLDTVSQTAKDQLAKAYLVDACEVVLEASNGRMVDWEAVKQGLESIRLVCKMLAPKGVAPQSVVTIPATPKVLDITRPAVAAPTKSPVPEIPSGVLALLAEAYKFQANAGQAAAQTAPPQVPTKIGPNVYSTPEEQAKTEEMAELLRLRKQANDAEAARKVALAAQAVAQQIPAEVLARIPKDVVPTAIGVSAEVENLRKLGFKIPYDSVTVYSDASYCDRTGRYHTPNGRYAKDPAGK